MTKRPFGKLPEGTPVGIYTLRDGAFEARIATYGGAVDGGRVLKVLTHQPGIQFDSGGVLEGSIKRKGGRFYAQHAALCPETQYLPDSTNHKDSPSAELNAGQRYHTVTVFRFSAR